MRRIALGILTILVLTASLVSCMIEVKDPNEEKDSSSNGTPAAGTSVYYSSTYSYSSNQPGSGNSNPATTTPSNTPINVPEVPVNQVNDPNSIQTIGEKYLEIPFGNIYPPAAIDSTVTNSKNFVGTYELSSDRLGDQKFWVSLLGDQSVLITPQQSKHNIENVFDMVRSGSWSYVDGKFSLEVPYLNLQNDKIIWSGDLTYWNEDHDIYIGEADPHDNLGVTEILHKVSDSPMNTKVYSSLGLLNGVYVYAPETEENYPVYKALSTRETAPVYQDNRSRIDASAIRGLRFLITGTTENGTLKGIVWTYTTYDESHTGEYGTWEMGYKETSITMIQDPDKPFFKGDVDIKFRSGFEGKHSLVMIGDYLCIDDMAFARFSDK